MPKGKEQNDLMILSVLHMAGRRHLVVCGSLAEGWQCTSGWLMAESGCCWASGSAWGTHHAGRWPVHERAARWAGTAGWWQ